MRKVPSVRTMPRPESAAVSFRGSLLTQRPTSTRSTSSAVRQTKCSLQSARPSSFIEPKGVVSRHFSTPAPRKFPDAAASSTPSSTLRPRTGAEGSISGRPASVKRQSAGDPEKWSARPRTRTRVGPAAAP